MCFFLKKKLEPHMKSDFVKECILIAERILTSEKVRLFESRLLNMVRSIQVPMKEAASELVFYIKAVGKT